MADILVAQFEIESDSKGSARAAAYLENLTAINSTLYVLAVGTYKRESGSAYIVIITSAGAMTPLGSTALVSPGAGEQTVIAVSAEIESGGSANFAKALNAAVAAFSTDSPPYALTKFVSLSINVRNSGSSYATAILAS